LRSAPRRLTALQHIAWHSFTRPEEHSSNHIFYAQQLFQQYAIDCFSVVEQQRLKYIENNQSQLRVAVYSGLQVWRLGAGCYDAAPLLSLMPSRVAPLLDPSTPQDRPWHSLTLCDQIYVH
jgi:hypothetical protein